MHHNISGTSTHWYNYIYSGHKKLMAIFLYIFRYGAELVVANKMTPGDVFSVSILLGLIVLLCKFDLNAPGNLHL